MIKQVKKLVPRRLQHVVRNSLVRTLHRLSYDRPDISTRLTTDHLRDAKLLPAREDLLQLLPKGGVVAELGVDHGEFSEEILEQARPAVLHLVDAWHTPRYSTDLMREVESKFSEQIGSGKIVMHRGISTDVLQTFDDAFFDWVYIDTSHDYQTTVNELKWCQRKVKPGGIIAGHDYVTGNWNNFLRYGVVEAVNEFCVENRWKFVYLTHETDRHLSFAIQQI